MAEDTNDLPDLTTPEGISRFFKSPADRRSREVLTNLEKEWSISKESPESRALRESYESKLDGGYMFRELAEKCKYIKKHTGWKIHLNVLPSNVNEVSEFLKSGGYRHKYLRGASIDQGKIFTVYFGPKSLAEECIQEISDGVGNILEKPKASGEQLAAPNIVARFEIEDPRYTPHSYHDGIPLMRYYDENNIEKSTENSKNYLLKRFGDYFGGHLTTYDRNTNK